LSSWSRVNSRYAMVETPSWPYGRRSCSITVNGRDGRTVMDGTGSSAADSVRTKWNRRATSARTMTVSIIANVLPMQVRGPPPNVGDGQRSVAKHSAQLRHQFFLNLGMLG